VAYRIDKTGDLGDDIRRIALETTEDAIYQLSRPRGELGLGIHEARRRFKRMRAMLRLIRRPMGACYRLENERFRVYGRRLSDARDAQAMVECFDKVTLGGQDAARKCMLSRVRDLLLERSDRLSAASPGVHQAARQVREELIVGRGLISQWELCHLRNRDLAEGFERTRRSSRKAYIATRVEPSFDHFHEWRKQTKYYWYQCRLLKRAFGSGLTSRRKQSKYLSELLGDYHDLAVLPRVLGELLDSGEVDQQQLEPLFAMVAERRSALEQIALKRGGKLFAKRPVG
jgi:hypothetical protein